MKKNTPLTLEDYISKTVLLCSLTESEHRLDAYIMNSLFTASSTLPAMQW